jgi:anti-sigma-K factor RskA
MVAPQPDETERVSGEMTRELDDSMPEGGDDMIAAEYVLGTLPSAERVVVSERIRTERAFARLVDEWTTRLSPLDDAYGEMYAPESVKKAVDAKLFAGAAASAQGFWQNLYFWRALTFAAMAVAGVAILPNLRTSGPDLPALPPIIAPMQSDTGEVRFVALYQPGSDEIRISRVKAEKGADRDYELWLVDDGAKPQSMGVIPDLGEVRLKVKAEFIAKINAGDAFAVSVEPTGGSPTGEASGPIIAVGVTKAI